MSTNEPDRPAKTGLRTTALHPLHRAHQARTAEFAGYEMPIRYEPGIIAEHQHTRTSAGLFDVSHMGVIEIYGDDRIEWLESIVPADLAVLGPGRLRYTFFTNQRGGVLDDLMVTKLDDRLSLVVNAGRKEDDLRHLEALLSGDIELRTRPDLALLALQGPLSPLVLSSIYPEVDRLAFMSSVDLGSGVSVSRSGYTGEDGYEIMLPGEACHTLAEELLSHPEVTFVGLGARDSLRLEAGLCLYGHDLTEEITPVEADLVWAIQKRRRSEGGFPGDQVILDQIANGPGRRRVGLRPEGRAPVREGAVLLDELGIEAGFVTSGGFGPTVGAPIAMGYVATPAAAIDTRLIALVRSKEVPCRVAELPFVEHRYYRGTK